MKSKLKIVHYIYSRSFKHRCRTSRHSSSSSSSRASCCSRPRRQTGGITPAAIGVWRGLLCLRMIYTEKNNKEHKELHTDLELVDHSNSRNDLWNLLDLSDKDRLC